MKIHTATANSRDKLKALCKAKGQRHFIVYDRNPKSTHKRYLLGTEGIYVHNSIRFKKEAQAVAKTLGLELLPMPAYIVTYTHQDRHYTIEVEAASRALAIAQVVLDAKRAV